MIDFTEWFKHDYRKPFRLKSWDFCLNVHNFWCNFFLNTLNNCNTYVATFSTGLPNIIHRHMYSRMRSFLGFLYWLAFYKPSLKKSNFWVCLPFCFNIQLKIFISYFPIQYKYSTISAFNFTPILLKLLPYFCMIVSDWDDINFASVVLVYIL